MFVATALLYPCVLAALCAGAGLLVDRLSGGFLPPALLLSVGAAALIALSQLSTYVSALAPATPYLMARARRSPGSRWGGRGRARCARRCRAAPWLAAVSVLAYALALAPVLLAGRAHLLLLHGPRGLRRAPDRRRLPDPPRPGLRAPGPAQLLRPVHPRLLQHQLPLRRGHAVRRQRLAAAACR